MMDGFPKRTVENQPACITGLHCNNLAGVLNRLFLCGDNQLNRQQLMRCVKGNPPVGI